MEELALIYRKEKVIKIISKVKDNKYILSIKDNGRGMERKTLHRIGDDEFTLKDSNHSGLGLFFVFDIIANDFKGSVIVNTKEKKYTEIIVEIPL